MNNRISVWWDRINADGKGTMAENETEKILKEIVRFEVIKNFYDNLESLIKTADTVKHAFKLLNMSKTAVRWSDMSTYLQDALGVSGEDNGGDIDG